MLKKMHWQLSSRANASSERHGREFESHQFRRFSYKSVHSTDNAESFHKKQL